MPRLLPRHWSSKPNCSVPSDSPGLVTYLRFGVDAWSEHTIRLQRKGYTIATVRVEPADDPIVEPMESATPDDSKA